MANIGDLQQVLDLMQMEQQQFGRLHGESLANIDTGIKDLAGINAQMLDAMSAIQQSLAPDTFGAAQATETTRETPGADVVSGPADASSVTPQQGKKKMGMLGMLGIAAAGAAAGLVAAFAGFLDFDAQKVKDKVLILTSIADAVDAGDTAETVATLTSLGVGLAAFGLGSIATGIGQTFMKDDWAVRIKNSVATLVGIGDLDFGKALKATLNLGTIGLGLAAFGLLSGVGALGQALADSFNKEGWAQNIVANVATLVSIGDLSFLKALEAAGTLKTIGAGLAVFGVGAGVAKFATPGFADDIKDNVETLASITDEVSKEEAEQFNETMGNLSAGLLKFSGSTFISSLMDAGAKLFQFLSGGESPIKQMLNVADQADDLEKGSKALERINSAISGITDLKFDGGDINISKFAEDLVSAVPAIEKAIMGGKAEGGFFSKIFGSEAVEFAGLASGDIKYDEAIKNITALRKALGAEDSGGGAAASSMGVSPGAMGGPVPASAASGVSGSSVQVVAEDLSMPYDKREQKKRAGQLASAMGFSSVDNVTIEGKVPTAINGTKVPFNLFTDEEIDAINAVRTMRAGMAGTQANLIPTNQSGSGLQTAQAEANENSGAGAPNGAPTVVSTNVQGGTTNNSSFTASRNNHDKPDFDRYTTYDF